MEDRDIVMEAIFRAIHDFRIEKPMYKPNVVLVPTMYKNNVIITMQEMMNDPEPEDLEDTKKIVIKGLKVFFVKHLLEITVMEIDFNGWCEG